MAYIKTLKDNELIGGTDQTDVYPVSTSQAIFRQNPDGTVPEGIQHQRLEESLQDHEEDAKELHRKAEKLALYLSNNYDDSTIEIDGSGHLMALKGSAFIETFGDEPAQSIKSSDLEYAHLSLTMGDATVWQYNGSSGSPQVPNAVGTYVATFTATHNGVTKSVTSNTYVNLRKYFGFADSTPTDVTVLGASDFSNSVGCTVTIPASGTGFKKIYFAVPIGMTIRSIVQPDALNAPLAFTQISGNVRVPIGSNTYSYKLYQSDDDIDSSVSKRLTIS